MRKPPFLKNIRHIHFVGIKGVGMTALACCAQDLAIKITGSDVGEIFVTDEILLERKMQWTVGFSEEKFAVLPDLVITTGAHGGLNNPEVKMAKKQGIKVLTQAEALGMFMEGKDGISVCGVGGKTTTSAMIAHIFSYAKMKPSFAVGAGKITSLGQSGKYNTGKHFITEGDEFANSPGIDNRPRFFLQNPKIVVATNIEYDHPDIYSSFDETKAVFKGMFEKVSPEGLLITSADNKNTQEVTKAFPSKETYGFSPAADWHVEKVYYGQGLTLFDLSYKGAIFSQIRLKVPGKFNVLNAVAAFAVAVFCGIEPDIIKRALGEYSGVKRRFEFVGEVQGVKLFDDYAHHPEEIKATLKAAKEWYPQNKLTVVFQPHTYSRTKALFDDFAHAFTLAHTVIITDVYASARETDTLGISSVLLAESAGKYHPRVMYKKGEKEVAAYLNRQANKGDIIITMGAGSIFLWHKTILDSLRN